MADVQQLMNSGTAIMQLHMLDDDKIMVVHDNRHLTESDSALRMGIVVMDTQGRSLLPGELLTEMVSIPHAGDGYIYIQKGPKSEQENPYLLRYRFVE